MSNHPNAVETAKAISHLVNVSDGSLPVLAEVLANDHRTLQQGFMRELVWPLLKLWAEDYESGRYDLRNEATTSLAHQIVATFKDDAHFPFI